MSAEGGEDHAARGPQSRNGQAWPQKPGPAPPGLLALGPAVAKGRRRAGITCKRRRPSCRGRSGSRPPLEPPLSSGSSSKTAAGRPTSSLTVQSPMAAFSTLATRRQPPQPPPSQDLIVVGEEGRGNCRGGQRSARRAPSPRQRPRGGENSPGLEPQCEPGARRTGVT